MTHFTILQAASRAAIFSGDFSSQRHCAEAALDAGHPLTGADLRGWNLTHATLDGADLRGAQLDGADFTGANLSECLLDGASARGCDFSQACLNQSRCMNVDFHNSVFTGALIAGAAFDGCTFSCPGIFALPFIDAVLGRNVYLHDNLRALTFTAAPIVVTGLPRRLVFLDEAVLLGSQVIARPPGSFDPARTLWALTGSSGAQATH